MRSMRPICSIGALTFLLVVAACGGTSTTGKSGKDGVTVAGHLVLSVRSASGNESNFSGGPTPTPGSACTGAGGYSDIVAGATVEAADASGKTLALGKLGPGVLSGSSPEANAADKYLCTFSFEMKNVPNSDFYKVSVSHRGAVTVAKADAATIALTLGT